MTATESSPVSALPPSRGKRDRRSAGISRNAQRSMARLAAAQALYQLEQNGGTAELIINEFILHRLGQELDGVVYAPADKDLFADIVRGAAAARESIDAILGKAITTAQGGGRLEPLMRAIFRAGVYELMAYPDRDVGLIVSNYTDVAGAFYEPRATSLVNATLNRIGRIIRDEDDGAR